ncbi:MAG: hypothetical protein JXB03_06210 [Spirochaetales bacterium]|nr:hypothetical protein [Spirochaetales bacterium]
MNFDFGDLLTLIIVFVILVIYRQLDLNNRSLEKVKKFSDKMKEELAGYVDTKAQDLKNLSIEVDVHQKAAKEVLKRITVIESGLQDKSSDIEHIFTRITSYDKALDELVKMTGRVEENLGRLHKESEFVDKVGKKVGEVSGSLKRLESDLGTIRQDFQKHNLKALDLVRKELLKKTQSDIIKSQERMGVIKTQVEEFSEFIGDLTARKDDVERDLTAAIEQMNRDAVKEIDASANRINDELMDVWQSQQKQFFDAIESKVKEGFERGGQLQSGFNTLITETKQALGSYEDKIKNSKSVLEANGKEVLAAVKKQLIVIQSEGESSIGKMSGDFAARLEALRAAEDQKGSDVISHLKVLHNELKQAVEDTDSTISQRLEEFQDQAGRIEHAYEEHLKTVAERGKNFEDDIFAKLREHIEKKAAETEKSLLGAIGEVRANIEEKKREFIAFFGDSRSEIAVWRTEVQKQLDDTLSEYESLSGRMKTHIGQAIDALTGRTDAMIEEQDKKYRGLAAGLDAAAKSFNEQIQRQSAGFADTVQERFTEMDSRISDYEESVSYKFSKIEEIGSDIDGLEHNLRASMDRISDKIRSEFREFHEALSSERAQEQAKARDDLGTIHQAVSQIEGELNELKQRAYDSVSEKLQVFEDEFFEDLRNRGQVLSSELKQWKDSLDQRMEDYAQGYEKQQKEMEARQAMDMEARLESLRDLFNERLAGFEENLSVFDASMKNRMEESNLGIRDLESRMHKEVAGFQSRSAKLFDEKIQASAADMEEALSAYRQQIETRMAGVKDYLASSSKETEGIIDSVRAGVTQWQSQVLSNMKETDNSVKERIADLRGSMTEATSAIKEEFISQREDLILNSQEERSRLKNELKDISETILALQEDLRRRSDEALLTFSKESETSLLEYQKKARELQMDMEVRTKDFRTAVSDIREKLETAQSRLLGKVEDEAKALEVTLVEIDKKQKAFISQTRVFEKADQLKESLSKSIEDLKSEISRIAQMSKDVRESEKEFSTVLKLAESANTKMARFLGEKRRIDSMDEDFAKLLNLSQTIDTKIAQMTQTHDTLQHIQADLMRLGELEESVEARYKRLESKEGLLERTTEGVDKNFSVISDMTKALKGVREEMSRIPAELSQLDQRVSLLAENKDQAEATITKLSGLDGVLSEIETRIEAMQEARQWLARTETRLEDVARQAQEQVKLLGSIMKEGAKRAKGKEKLDTRDVVIRLAREGWAVEEIARTTQLSRSEVELILELVAKKS